MNYAQLKPCPFCGAKTVNMSLRVDNGVAWVECDRCHTCGPEIDVDSACLAASGKAWNKRKEASR